MQVLQEHQFSSPVTNWKSKNRRKQHYIGISNNTENNLQNSNNIKKNDPIKLQHSNSVEKNDLKKSSSTKSVKKHQNPRKIPVRNQSFNCSAIKNISPTATSDPIAIPSDNKKVKFVEDAEKGHTLANSAPNRSFSMISTSEHTHRRANSSFDGIFKSNSLKESSIFIKNNKNSIPKINTSNLTKILENKMNTLDPFVDGNDSFSGIHSKISPLRVKSHEFSCSSASTLCQSPTITSANLSQTTATLSQEIESSSYTTLYNNSLDNDCSKFLSMSNDQLFKLLPKKIIKAIDNYTAHSTTEISYRKGDFFFVISENESYYFVTNPSTKSSGYVSKFSFQQVDKFGKSSKPFNADSGLSPIVEKVDNIISKESDPLTDRVMTANITEDIISRNTQNTFPIEISKIDGTVAVLNRSYNDICQLHNALMECFPEDCGSNTKERILPFLPSHDAIFCHPKKNPRQILSTYLQLLTQLPNKIQFSIPFEQFFSIRKDDILSSIYVVSHLNFFEDENEEVKTVKVKVVVENKESDMDEINIVRVSPKISYSNLFKVLEERFKNKFTHLYYCNESNEKVKLFGDHDLMLFFNSNNLSYALYAK